MAWADVPSPSGSGASPKMMGYLTNAGAGTWGMAHVAGDSSYGTPCIGEFGFVDRKSTHSDKRAIVTSAYYDTLKGYSVRTYVRVGLTGSMGGFALGTSLDNSGTLTTAGLAVNLALNTRNRTLSGEWKMNGSGLVVQNSSPTFSTVHAGAFISPIMLTSANYTLLAQYNSTVLFSGTSILTGTLPSAVNASGQIFNIKNIGTSFVKVVPPSGSKIDNASFYWLTGGAMRTITIQSDGNLYWIVS